jgi:hypothetical protein
VEKDASKVAAGLSESLSFEELAASQGVPRYRFRRIAWACLTCDGTGLAGRRHGSGPAVNAAIVDTELVSMLFKGDSRTENYRRRVIG